MPLARKDTSHWGIVEDKDREIGDDIADLTAHDIRAKWEEELRVTPLKQCAGYLRKWDTKTNAYHYDALGILLLVCVDLGVEDINEDEWRGDTIPFRTAEMVGLRCEDEGSRAEGGEIELIQALNDRGMGFQEIADHVRRRDFKPLHED
jgi:hypothetical protein